MAELLFLVSMFLPPLAIVAGALLLVAARGTDRRVSGKTAGYSLSAAA
jgi:hypothetical protein